MKSQVSLPINGCARATLLALILVFATAGCDGTRYIFSSSKDVAATPDQAGLVYEALWFAARDGVQLHGWFVPGKPGMPLVLFFHGNAANISHRVENLHYFNQLGLPVFIFDYRGFGQSRGQATSEEDLYQDARGALDYLTARAWSQSRIIYFGRSMGAAVSLQMGLEAPAAAVVMECPFTSLADIAWHTAPVSYALFGWWALDARFDNLAKIGRLATPLLIFQGDQDSIVPMQMAQRLFQKAPEPKAFHLIPGGGHSNLFQVGGEKYRQAWLDLIGGLSLSKESWAADER
ncbi:MAG: alpha/beta fold hydrolase [Desulfobacterales bacterium]|nr:MAG: alpha/beta fold hydrolase [Desulfobacterales bacterium]